MTVGLQIISILKLEIIYKSTTYQNLLNRTTAALRVIYIVLNTYIRKQKKFFFKN